MRRNIGIFALLMLVLMMLFVSCEAQPELPGNGNDVPPTVEEDAEINPLVGRWGFAEDRSAMFFEEKRIRVPEKLHQLHLEKPDAMYSEESYHVTCFVYI